MRINLELLPEEFRLPRIGFKAAASAFAAMEGRFRGNREYLAFQLIRLVNAFLASKIRRGSRRSVTCWPTAPGSSTQRTCWR